MPKKLDNELTVDMFPVDPEIRGLGISEFKIKAGDVFAILTGQTLVTDAASFNDETWKKSVAEWLVNLCGNHDCVQSYLDQARKIYFDRELEREAMQNALNNVTKIPFQR